MGRDHAGRYANFFLPNMDESTSDKWYVLVVLGSGSGLLQFCIPTVTEI